jgi:anti-sigma factor RsiW
MDHPRETELIDLAAGRLTGEVQERVEAHLATCAPCRERCDGLAQTGAALDAWTVPPASRDFAPGVLAAIEGESGAQRRPVSHRWWAIVRLAALIALAATTGHLAARWVGPGWSPRTTGPAAASAANEALHLDDLHDGAPAGLTQAVLGALDTDDQENRG